MANEIKLPELGENIESAQVVKILVAPGDKIKTGQNLIEIETDKASIEVPATKEGIIEKIHVKEGQSTSVGSTIVSLNPTSNNKSDNGEADNGESIEKEQEPKQKQPDQDKEKPYKPKAPEITQKVQETQPPKPDDNETLNFTKKSESFDTKKIIPASPSVRRFAREIGIDISQVNGNGKNSRISIDDIKAFAKNTLQNNSQNQQNQGQSTTLPPVKLPDFTKFGEIERTPMNNIRIKTAEHLTSAWQNIPHVTQFDHADITRTEKLRKEYAKQAESAGGKLTITAILIKITSAALQKFPDFNASVDMANKEITLKKYINIGIAVDTPRGLLVPVIKNVDKKNILDLAVELGEISQRARDKKTTLEEMQGGNFTISNLGGIGGSHFTPIINAPEVAILGVSRAKYQQVYENGEFVPRLIMPISLSYDHRIIDGALGIKFLRWIASALEQPFLLAL